MDKFSKARAGGGGGVKSKWALGSKTVLPKNLIKKVFVDYFSKPLVQHFLYKKKIVAWNRQF